MLKHCTRLCTPVLSNSTKAICRKESHLANITPVKRKYDLYSAICLERYPIITRPFNALEKKYSEYLQELELRNSLLCDFEIRKELEIKEDEMIRKGLKKVELDKPVTKRAIDIEEVSEQKLKEFKFASRTTEADEKHIVTSLNRKLDKNLLFLVEQKIGDKLFWVPPQSLRVEGESMKDAAYRALKEYCGDELKVKFYGNAPIGVYKYSYPGQLKKKLGSDGAKIFYFLAQYIKGSVPLKVKYQWLDRNEMKDVLPTEVYKSISRFLIPEHS